MVAGRAQAVDARVQGERFSTLLVTFTFSFRAHYKQAMIEMQARLEY